MARAPSTLCARAWELRKLPKCRWRFVGVNDGVEYDAVRVGISGVPFYTGGPDVTRATMIEAGLIGRVSAIKAQWHRNNNWRRPVPPCVRVRAMEYRS